MSKEHGHGNKISAHGPVQYNCEFRKVPADSVPYGESISRNGQTVWVAMVGEHVVCIGATSEEVKRKYLVLKRDGRTGGGSNVGSDP